MPIPGNGFINDEMILGEIYNIHRFSSPGKLLAFAGLDPSIYQSGNFQAKKLVCPKAISFLTLHIWSHYVLLSPKNKHSCEHHV